MVASVSTPGLGFYVKPFWCKSLLETVVALVFTLRHSFVVSHPYSSQQVIPAAAHEQLHSL
jgi:hypothetical protein